MCRRAASRDASLPKDLLPCEAMKKCQIHVTLLPTGFMRTLSHTHTHTLSLSIYIYRHIYMYDIHMNMNVCQDLCPHQHLERYVYLCFDPHIYLYIHIYTSISMHVYKCARACVCLYVCMYIYTYMYIHTHTHIYIYIYISIGHNLLRRFFPNSHVASIVGAPGAPSGAGGRQPSHVWELSLTFIFLDAAPLCLQLRCGTAASVGTACS